MADDTIIAQRFVAQLIWWYRRWRYYLIAFMALVWLPVLIYLMWELYLALFWQQQGFFRFPQAVVPFGEAWERPLLGAAYHLEYYAHFLRRLLAAIAAIGLATAFQLDPAGLRQVGVAQAYRALRHEVRGAVYGWMTALSLLPSVVSKVIRSAGLVPSGSELIQLVYPLGLLIVEWWSISEFLQWLLLRHYGRRKLWYYLIALPLVTLFFYIGVYLPELAQWGEEHVYPGYPHLVNALAIAAMLCSAVLWWWLARTPRGAFDGRVEAVEQAAALRATAPPARLDVTYRLRQWLPVAGVLVLVGTIWLAVLRSGVLYDPPVYPNPDLTIPYASTRGQMYYGKLKPGVGRYDYDLYGKLPCIDNPAAAPKDLLIAVHGFKNSALNARYMFDLTQASALHCGYTGCMAGFSWDANTQHDPLSATGFGTGDRHAVLNGPKLARFIVDLKRHDPGLRVHVIGYSMGARIALEALLALSSDPELAPYHVKIDTVHLFGASVNRSEVEVGERYGAAIENSTGVLYNYYSPPDVALGSFYWVKKVERSLGEESIADVQRQPANYVSVDASAELLTFDKQGKLESAKTGQNHKGYLGQKDPQGNLLDDGAVSLAIGFIQGSASTDAGKPSTASAPQHP